MKVCSAIFLFLSCATAVSAEQVNIVCNLTRSISDKANLNGPTSGTFTAIIDDQSESIILNSRCSNAAIAQYTDSVILIECSDQYFNSTYRIDRISGELVWSLYGNDNGFLIHYGQCSRAAVKF